MGLYDEVEIEDMAWDEGLQSFTFQCPCGDLFQISLVRFFVPLLRTPLSLLLQVLAYRLPLFAFHLLLCLTLLLDSSCAKQKRGWNQPTLLKQEELRDGEEIARCPSCSLWVQVIYDLVSSFLRTLDQTFQSGVPLSFTQPCFKC